MRILRTILTISFLFISSYTFAYESYDYSPIDDNEYSNNDVAYNDDYYGSRNYERERNYERTPNYKKMSNKRSSFIGGSGKTFVFDPKSLSWAAYANGSLINSGRASGGRFYCSDIHRPCKTPVGVFRVGHKGGPDCKSSKYPIGKGNAPMPWCMFFKGGFAIHGSWSVPGYNASHGCIRVPPSDARWLNQNFMSPGTKVVVKSYH